jgi:hypothetical protein
MNSVDDDADMATAIANSLQQSGPDQNTGYEFLLELAKQVRNHQTLEAKQVFNDSFFQHGTALTDVEHKALMSALGHRPECFQLGCDITCPCLGPEGAQANNEAPNKKMRYVLLGGCSNDGSTEQIAHAYACLRKAGVPSDKIICFAKYKGLPVHRQQKVDEDPDCQRLVLEERIIGVESEYQFCSELLLHPETPLFFAIYAHGKDGGFTVEDSPFVRPERFSDLLLAAQIRKPVLGVFNVCFSSELIKYFPCEPPKNLCLIFGGGWGMMDASFWMHWFKLLQDTAAGDELYRRRPLVSADGLSVYMNALLDFMEEFLPQQVYNQMTSNLSFVPSQAKKAADAVRERCKKVTAFNQCLLDDEKAVAYMLQAVSNLLDASKLQHLQKLLCADLQLPMHFPSTFKHNSVFCCKQADSLLGLGGM